MKKWIDKNIPSLSGKRIAVSGSTGGIGSALCRQLCYLGASLVLIDRNLNKSCTLADSLRAEFASVDITHITADMSDMESVKRAADELSELGIDYLILNAGAYCIPRYTCDTGYGNVFQINFLSPYYLARQMLPSIEKRGGRVIAVGSIAHNYSKTDPNDIDFSKKSRASLVYGNSKRFLTYSLLALESNSVAVAHPGISFTGITNHYPPLVFALIKEPMKIIFMRPDKAALSILYAICAEVRKDEWIGPRLFDVWGVPRVKKLRTATENEKKYIADTAEKIYKKM